ncbi:MAG: EF-hand domain-containing protein [Candidatus Gastranaerophilaceae bacterium]
MVDGVGNNNQQNNILRLKKQNKTIDLTKLEGLRQTDKNEAIFEKFDINKDGKIDKDEAKKMQELLYKASGDGLMSKREMKKNFGDKSTFDALSTLADQQAAISGGKEYVEQNGNTTTHITTGYHRYDKTKLANNVTKTEYENGTTYVTDGKFGYKTYPDGNITIYSPAGYITKDKDGKILEKSEIINGKEEYRSYEYTQDNKTIVRNYVGDNLDLTTISVNYNQNGHTISRVYNSEEDLKNNKPAQEITDGLNDALAKITNFTYDENGNVKAETTDSAGQKTVKYTNEKGEEIQPEAEDTPTKHTVQKGESITQIVTRYLKEQGVENPTSEQIKYARDEFLEANKDIVQTYNGPKAEYKGNKFFHPNDEVTIPKFSVYEPDAKVLDEVVVTATAPTEEAKQQRAQLQELLGDKAEVGYNKDGKVEVRDKEDGHVLSQAEITALTSNEDDINTMLSADKNDNKTLDKDEYKQLIVDMLTANGIEISDANREKIEQLIDNSFTAMDTIAADGELTREELQANAKNVIAQLTDDLLDADA